MTIGKLFWFKMAKNGLPMVTVLTTSVQFSSKLVKILTKTPNRSGIDF
ncbi:hypothetical protein [Acidaminobacter sp.]|nr:hypothetical protein [Acidaminobacter sp.]MDK9711362.1 hypothetical protein [Acidaminobacter sp.]MZQ96585.1 hypothetical protein [Acidaminobacter sp.]